MEILQITRLALLGWVGLVAVDPASGADARNETLPTSPSGGLSASPTGAPASETSNVAPPRQAYPSFVPPGRTRATDWTFSAGANASLTLTDNVALAPPGQEQSDTVLAVAVPLRLRRDGLRLKFQGEYTPTFYQYARRSDANNVQNDLRSLLSFEAVDNFLFVDATANIYQSYISPSAARPESGASITQNRAQQTNLGISPYVRRVTDRDWTYLIRNDNYWNTYDVAGLGPSVTNSVTADVKSPPARLRYGFDYTYLQVDYRTEPIAYYQQVGRVRPIFTVTPRLNVSARLGYETNDYATTNSGPVYGVGAHWTPTPRTKLDGFIEHRFFGSSYRLDLIHRTRLTSWRLSGTRDVYTAQDQTLALQPTTTAEVLNDELRSQIPNPVERDQAVQKFMQQAGLPQTLTQPYSFYTNQPYVSQQWQGSVGLLGRRNSVALTFLWEDDKTVTSSSSFPPGVFVGFDEIRQRGVTLTFTHQLSPYSTVALTGNRLYSNTQQVPGAANIESIQDTLGLSVSHQLSPKTTASVGVRWTNFDSDIVPYREHAVLGVLSHRF